jgi:hypothetical protein
LDEVQASNSMKKNLNSQNSSTECSQKYKRFPFFVISELDYSQIWLNILVNDHQFGCVMIFFQSPVLGKQLTLYVEYHMWRSQ